MQSVREDNLLFVKLGQGISNKTLQELDEVSSECFFLLDNESRQIKFISKSCLGILGYPRDQISLRLFLRLIHSDDQPGVMRYYSSISNNYPGNSLNIHKNQLKCIDFRIRHGLDRWVWIALNCVLVVNCKIGSKDLIFGCIRDINERKIEELKLVKAICPENNGTLKSVVPRDYLALNSYSNDKILTPREKQVLRLIACGRSSKQIAENLCVSTHTIVKHRKNIIAKFRVKNTAQLIREATRFYWI